MPAHHRLLGVTGAAVGQAMPLAEVLGDHPLGHLLGHRFHVRGRRLLLLVVRRGVERLRELGAVAVQGHRLEHAAPGEVVGPLDVLDGGVHGHVDGLADRARDEGLGRRHHPDVRLGGDEARALLAAAVGAVEDGQVGGFQQRRALDGHGAAAVVVGRLDLGGGEAHRAEQVAVPLGELRLVDAEPRGDIALAERPGVEREGDVERALDRGFQPLQARVVEALGAERVVVDGRRAPQGLAADAVGHDVVDLDRGVAEGLERERQALVGDLEVAAARELLELHQGEVGLDAGGVAIHDEADGAGRGEDRDLGVAVAELLAEPDRPVPGLARGLEQRGRAVGRVDAGRRDAEALVLHRGDPVGGPPVVAHHPQHVGLVLVVAREGAEVSRHLRGGRVGLAAHDRGHRPADRGGLRGIVGDAPAHEHGAHVGVAQAQGTEVPAPLGDRRARVGGHQHADLEHRGPQAAGVAEAVHVERCRPRGGTSPC